MTKGQNKRQIGKGMKPRGNQRVKPQKEEEEMPEQSTVEGQQIPVPAAVLEVREGYKTPGNLEPENGGESFQNLESPEKIVAHDDSLEAALKESGYEPAEPSLDDIESAIASGIKPDIYADLETAMAVGTGTVKGIKVLQEAYGSVNFPDPPSEASVSMDIRGVPTSFHLGLQPDGTTKVVVTIGEGYFDAVTQWAEADNVPVEQWLSDRLYEYISTYGEPAKAR